MRPYAENISKIYDKLKHHFMDKNQAFNLQYAR